MNREILAFCHIVKAGGTTIENLLRNELGLRHLDVIPNKVSGEYGSRELARDLAFMPWIKSMAGHGLRPYIDYDEHQSNLKWVVWLREPVSRLISGYQHSCQRNGCQEDFASWLSHENRRNRQVYFLSGSADSLEAAKAIIKDRIEVVGLLEKYSLSVSLLQAKFPDLITSIEQPQKKNEADSHDISKTIYDNLDKYSEQLSYAAGLDIELYNWVKEVYYDTQFDNLEFKSMVDDSAPDTSSRSFAKISNRLVYRLFYWPLLSKI